MSLGERIKKALAYSELNQNQLARRVGVSAQAVGQWIRSSQVKRSHIAEIAAATGVEIRWLLTGEQPMQTSQIAQSRSEYGAAGVRWLPLLQWQQLDAFTASAPSAAATAGAGIYYAGGCSEAAFALTVQGRSMTAPFGLSVPEGYIIVVDPEQAESVVAGDLLLAYLPQQERPVFKQLAYEDASQCLRPLNPHHPPVLEPFQVIGRVLEARLPL